jgi:hypothetical protein
MKGKIALGAGILTIVTGILCWLVPDALPTFLPLTIILWFIGTIIGNIAWSKEKQINGKRGFTISMVGWGIAVAAFFYQFVF